MFCDSLLRNQVFCSSTGMVVCGSHLSVRVFVCIEVCFSFSCSSVALDLLLLSAHAQRNHRISSSGGRLPFLDDLACYPGQYGRA